MTLIDKAEALAACPFCGGEASHNGGGGSVFGRMWWTVGCKTCDIWFSDPEVWSKTDLGMLDPAYPPKHCFTAWNRRAALPARGVGVKPLIFSEFKEGVCMGRPHPFQYFITQTHDGRFLCHHDETWHDTLEAAQAHAQVAYQVAAFVGFNALIFIATRS